MVGLPVAVLVAIVVYPTIWMAYHAFQDTNMMSLFSGNWTFVGWQNFATALTDDRFLGSVRHLVRICCSAPAFRSCSAWRWR